MPDDLDYKVKSEKDFKKLIRLFLNIWMLER